MTTNMNMVVADGDEIDRLLDGKFEDLKRRVGGGTLPLRHIAEAFQEMVEGKFVLGGLLKFVGSVKLKGVRRFSVAENFREGNIVGGRSIGWIGPNFRKHYYGLVEEDVPARTAYIWELIQNALDETVEKKTGIIDVLGGKDDPKTQTYLAHMFQMMELGEKGRGRLDGYANLGYKISPKDGKLWVPCWFVGGGRFGVEAGSSSGPSEWGDGSRVSGG